MLNKRIGITQKIAAHPKYNEINLSLDFEWINLLISLNVMPIPLPVVKDSKVKFLLENLKLDGIILTGGNDLGNYSQKSLQQEKLNKIRDHFENEVIAVSIELNLPILGICRGLQLINVYFSGRLEQVSGHVNTRHKIKHNNPKIRSLEDLGSVNSFHNWGIPFDGIGLDLRPVAVDQDGYIECVEHVSLDISGIMWHPERERPFKEADLNLIKRVLKLI